jgi:hypothetical protein
MRNDIALYVGCIAGASKVEEYEAWLSEAGFRDAVLVDAKSDLNVYLQTDDEGNVTGGACCGDTAAVEKDAGACCSSGETETEKGVMQDLKKKYGDLDLNEWLGKCMFWFLKSFANDRQGRIRFMLLS